MFSIDEDEVEAEEERAVAMVEGGDEEEAGEGIGRAKRVPSSVSSAAAFAAASMAAASASASASLNPDLITRLMKVNDSEALFQCSICG